MCVCVCVCMRACTVCVFHITFNACDSGMALTSVNTMQMEVTLLL